MISSTSLAVVDGVSAAKRFLAETRFWSKVEKADGDACWFWQGRPDGGGYGVFKVDGQVIRAHRVAWIFTNGPILNGLHVCHRCDVRRCVRPDHLFLGTNLENMADMRAKKRGRTSPKDGENHPCAKLTWEDVAAIRVAHASGEAQTKIAARLRVSPGTISAVVHGRTWQSTSLSSTSGSE